MIKRVSDSDRARSDSVTIESVKETLRSRALLTDSVTDSVLSEGFPIDKCTGLPSIHPGVQPSFDNSTYKMYCVTPSNLKSCVLNVHA